MSELCFWSTKDVVLKLLPNVYVLLTKQSLKLQTGSVLLLCVSGSEQGCCANGFNRFFFVSGPQISILSWWLLSLCFWTKYWISYGFYVAALLIPKCSMSKRFRKCVLPMPKKTPWPNWSQLLVVCSDQTKASCSKCFLRFLVFLIQRKRNAQMVSVLPLCFWSRTRLLCKWYISYCFWSQTLCMSTCFLFGWTSNSNQHHPNNFANACVSDQRLHVKMVSIDQEKASCLIGFLSDVELLVERKLKFPMMSEIHVCFWSQTKTLFKWSHSFRIQSQRCFLFLFIRFLFTFWSCDQNRYARMVYVLMCNWSKKGTMSTCVRKPVFFLTKWIEC